MGYLSQKKHQIRENIFLYVMALLFAGLSIFSISCPGFKIVFFNLFHLYLFSFALMVYALIVKKYKPAIIFCLVFIISYTTLSSSVNLFISDKFQGVNNINLVYDSKKSLAEEFSKGIVSSGAIILADKFISPYVTIDKNSPVTIIRVNLNDAKYEQYPVIFKHLRQFIIKQDNPVIIYGEFGVPAWNKIFKKFLRSTGLSVKNKLIFTKSAKYNIFTDPTFYVLGFHEMGISDITISTKDNYKVIQTGISFNPAHL